MIPYISFAVICILHACLGPMPLVYVSYHHNPCICGPCMTVRLGIFGLTASALFRAQLPTEMMWQHMPTWLTYQRMQSCTCKPAQHISTHMQKPDRIRMMHRCAIS